MRTMQELPIDLAEVCARHYAWRCGWTEGVRADLTRADLTRVDLTDANLTDANLTGADLRGANLTDANLTGADLTRANIRDANLTGADLRDANLTDANLTRAHLWDADLTRANLTGADLRDANLADANLTGADLRGANLAGANLAGADLTGATGLAYQIPQEGELVVWKYTTGGPVKLRIPPEARRTASIVGRKCRAEFATVLEGEGDSTLDAAGPTIHYAQGLTVRPDSYDPDPRVECSHGIHFYLTREEC